MLPLPPIRLRLKPTAALNNWFFSGGDFYHAAAQAGLSDEDFVESLPILVEKQILLLGRDEPGAVRAGQLTNVGLDCYLQSCQPSYLEEQLGVRRKLAECFFKEVPEVSHVMLTLQLGYPRLVVDHVLRVFARHGLLRITGPGNRDPGEVFIDGITPEIVGGPLLGYGI